MRASEVLCLQLAHVCYGHRWSVGDIASARVDRHVFHEVTFTYVERCRRRLMTGRKSMHKCETVTDRARQPCVVVPQFFVIHDS